MAKHHLYYLYVRVRLSVEPHTVKRTIRMEPQEGTVYDLTSQVRFDGKPRRSPLVYQHTMILHRYHKTRRPYPTIHFLLQRSLRFQVLRLWLTVQLLLRR
jgi:hypothetical protein